MSSEVKNTLLRSIRSNLRQNQFSWILIKSGGLIITTGEESLRLKRENKTDGAVITRRHPPVTPSILSAPPAAVSSPLRWSHAGLRGAEPELEVSPVCRLLTSGPPGHPGRLPTTTCAAAARCQSSCTASITAAESGGTLVYRLTLKKGAMKESS